MADSVDVFVDPDYKWIVLDCFEAEEQCAQLELTPEQAIDIAAELLIHALMAQRRLADAKPKLKVVDDAS